MPYTIIKRDVSHEAWRRLMDTSPVASWFQSPEAYDFYCGLTEMMTPQVVAVVREEWSESESERGKRLVGVMLGYTTREKSHVRQYFTRRTIVIGGPLLADDIQDAELEALLKAFAHTEKQDIHTQGIYIETRNFNDYSRWKDVFIRCGYDYYPHYDMHIACTNQEEMWNKIHTSKQRAIRKALAEGQQVAEATSENEVRQFYTLLSQLYRTKVHRPLFPVEFFLRGWHTKTIKVLTIKDKCGNIKGGAFCPIGCNTIYEWYIVGNIMPTFAIMNYACNHQIERFDLMGAGEPNVPYGVRDFKAQFGGELKEYGRFVYVTRPCLYAIGKMAVKLFTI